MNWTTAQKADVSRLRPGLFLGFHRAVKGIARNETVEVIEAGKGRAVVRNEQGEMRIITGKQAKSFDVYERKSIEIASGDKLILTANRRTKGFNATNGEIVTVSKIDDHSRIHLHDGRVLPKDYRQFAYGYAVTAHRSQGKTVDAVIISGDNMRKELFYVAVSRGRENLAVVTSDKERLREAIGRSTARQSASELVQKLRPGLHQSINRGMEAARRLVEWAARQFKAIYSPEPAMKHEPVTRREPTTSHAPATNHAPAVKPEPVANHEPATRHTPAVKHESATRHEPTTKHEPVVKHEPTMKKDFGYER
jgi:hypothetical protein